MVLQSFTDPETKWWDGRLTPPWALTFLRELRTLIKCKRSSVTAISLCLPDRPLLLLSRCAFGWNKCSKIHIFTPLLFPPPFNGPFYYYFRYRRPCDQGQLAPFFPQPFVVFSLSPPFSLVVGLRVLHLKLILASFRKSGTDDLGSAFIGQSSTFFDRLSDPPSCVLLIGFRTPLLPKSPTTVKDPLS